MSGARLWLRRTRTTYVQALKEPMSGLISRNPYTAGNITGLWPTVIAGTVVNVRWKDLQPTAGFQSIVDSAGCIQIDNELDAIAANLPAGARLRIRVDCGINSPDWLKTLMGSVIVCDNSGTNGIYWSSTTAYVLNDKAASNINGNSYKLKVASHTGGSDPSADSTNWSATPSTWAGKYPIYWSTAPDANGFTHLDYFADMMAQLSDIYDSNPNVADICFAAGTAVYDEVMGHQTYRATPQINPASMNAANLATARGNGGGSDYFTSVKELAAYQSHLSVMKAAWTQGTRVYIAYLNYDYPSTTNMANGSLITLSGTPQNIPVVSTAAPAGEDPSRGFAASGTVVVGGVLVTYTSVDATHFKGCTGSGTIAAGASLAVYGGNQDFAVTQSAIAAAVEILGEQAVLGNNGYKNDTSGTQSATIWTEIAAYNGAISVQSTTYSKIGNAGADLPIDMANASVNPPRALCFELPEGYQAFTATDSRITAAIAALKANWMTYHPRVSPMTVTDNGDFYTLTGATVVDMGDYYALTVANAPTDNGDYWTLGV